MPKEEKPSSFSAIKFYFKKKRDYILKWLPIGSAQKPIGLQTIFASVE